tara:strand:- start:400 stop:1149 length:750 start_codon:yes stop_codon:yes gene_type:complete
MNKKITIVTTFSDKGYEVYAKHCIASLKKYVVGNDIEVIVYTDTPYNFEKNNWTNKILQKEVPELELFKIRNAYKKVPDGTKGFIWDGVRFSHKSYAWCHTGLNTDSDIVIWLDADTEVIENIDANYLTKFMPDGYVSSYLGRPGRYTETGWLAWNMQHSDSKRFFTRFKQYYDEDLIYDLKGFTDCHVYDAVRQEFEAEGIKSYNITKDMPKDVFNQAFKGYMTHYKGPDKTNREKYYSKAMRRKMKG